jgi:dihydroneopterin aldolase|tara:strand:- start:132 stop:506 length:375 start_codon:yes stop_codon:yes gene_type:complete
MKINKSLLSLNGLKFNSKIGVYDFEKLNGNEFIINISLNIDNNNFDDHIKKALDYELVYGIIELVMNKSFNLIETAAYEISKNIYLEFDQISSSTIEIIKLKPKIKGGINNSTFLLKTEREING